jgi:hypothetical protein
MTKIVREQLGIHDILKPKSSQDIISEFERRIAGKDIKVIKKTPEYTIYHVKKGADIKDIIRGFGDRTEENIFFNFYLILDNTDIGFRQVIGVKVGPNDDVKAMDARGSSIDIAYLEKFA